MTEDSVAQHLRSLKYRVAEKSLARPARKQAQKHVRDSRDFNNVETRAVIKLYSLQGKAPKEIHATMTEILACFLPGQAKDLSAPMYLEALHVQDGALCDAIFPQMNGEIEIGIFRSVLTGKKILRIWNTYQFKSAVSVIMDQL